jgi:hypothetical protein
MKFLRTKLLLVWLAITGISVAVAFGLYSSGKAADCRPSQIDGQCGLATAMGEMSGILAGLTIFLIGTIACGVVALRRRQKATQQTESESNTL